MSRFCHLGVPVEVGAISSREITRSSKKEVGKISCQVDLVEYVRELQELQGATLVRTLLRVCVCVQVVSPTVFVSEELIVV